MRLCQCGGRVLQGQLTRGRESWSCKVCGRYEIFQQGESMNDCPNCEYHRQRAQRWRDEAYKLSGHPLPEREWVGLTDDEIEGAIDDGFAFGLDDGNVSNDYVIRYVRVIEAKLKERNS